MKKKSYQKSGNYLNFNKYFIINKIKNQNQNQYLCIKYFNNSKTLIFISNFSIYCKYFYINLN